MSKIIGINYGPHDTSVCLLEDGKIICAIEEEKLTGVKACYVNYEYPTKSLDYIEKEFGVTIDNCDHLAFSRAYVRQFVKDRPYLGGKISSFSHHDCHALGSYFTSGFEGKVISLSHDGKGYRSRGKLFICEDGQFEEIHSQHIPTTASLAGLWAVSTLHLGWRMLKDEGKVVGLAAHGKFSEEIYSHLKQFMYYENFEFKPSNWECLFHYTFNTYKKDNAKIKEWREDFAFTLQKFTEEIFGEFLNDIHKRFPEYRKICFSGGLFANVKLNQFINELDIFDEIFIHPAMGDGGLAMGAALLKAHELGEIEKPQRLKNAFLGPSHNFNDWNTAISESNLRVKKEPFTFERVAELIDQGFVVGCFFGRTEYGPRALGNRSIVVKPTDPDTHRKLNEKLRRTEIMPFAPSVLKEEADKVFECDKSKYTAEFMTLCYNARDEWKEKIPAVIQILDSSARPQMVDYDLNPNFHSIISSYHKLSGIPLVLNTSFNAHGEPINNYPSQVMKHLGDGSVDFIANEHYILSINRD
jgi:carbamoyltransferase